MALRNWTLATYGTTVSGSGTGSISGTVEDIRDLNLSTAYTVANGEITARITFKNPVTLKEIFSKIIAGASSTPGSGNYSLKAYNSSNSLISTISSASGTLVSEETTHIGTWANVKYLEVTAGGGGLNGGGATIWEITAKGIAYEDIGLRIRTSSSTIKIGVEDLKATHKLRIIKDGVIYGIPLLATSDSNASGLRIYDGSSIKALPKVT